MRNRSNKNLCALLMLCLSAIIVVSILAVGYVEKLRPIKVFTHYYLCRIAEVTNLFDVDCRALPTVAIQPPENAEDSQPSVSDPRELQLFFETHSLPKHIYSHGTNSPEHARVYKNYYRAFEFDAFWDEKQHVVDIFHWPNDASINFHFRNLLAIIPVESFLWMDFKNLSMDNLSEFRLYMETIFKEHPGFDKKNIIIESKTVEAVSQLRQHGYQTSYYLPDIRYNGACQSIQLTEKIVTNIKNFPTSYISYPYFLQKYVDECLLPQTGSLKQISWGGVPFAFPKDASNRYHAYIVDHDLHLHNHTVFE